jgi:hypothetical protein
LLGLVEDLAQLRDRREDQVDEEDEGQHGADVEPPTRSLDRCHPDDRREGQAAEEVGEREHQGEVLRCPHLSPVLSRDRPIEPLT